MTCCGAAQCYSPMKRLESSVETSRHLEQMGLQVRVPIVIIAGLEVDNPWSFVETVWWIDNTERSEKNVRIVGTGLISPGSFHEDDANRS